MVGLRGPALPPPPPSQTVMLLRRLPLSLLVLAQDTLAKQQAAWTARQRRCGGRSGRSKRSRRRLRTHSGSWTSKPVSANDGQTGAHSACRSNRRRSTHGTRVRVLLNGTMAGTRRRPTIHHHHHQCRHVGLISHRRPMSRRHHLTRHRVLQLNHLRPMSRESHHRQRQNMTISPLALCPVS